MRPLRRLPFGCAIVTAVVLAVSLSASPAGSQPKRGGELRVLLVADVVAGYDPAKSNLATMFAIAEQVFETLVQGVPEADGRVVPNLAESWTVSPDGLTYTFKLRKGVKFHNGRDMTAEDVRFSIERLRDKTTASPRFATYQVVDTIETPDPHTVTFRLKEPFAPLLANLSQINSAIVPKEGVQQEGGLDKKPIGTGPFRFVEWIRDQRVVVERNKDYWRQGLPYLDRIVFTFNRDESARTAALRSGAIDFLYRAPNAHVDILKKDPSIALYGGEGSRTFLYLLLNMQRKPFDDMRVRHAIFYALDRQGLADLAQPGQSAVVSCGFIPVKAPAGVKESCYKQDYVKAKQLLAEAGYAKGFKFTISVATGLTHEARAGQGLQQQLKPLGLETEVRLADVGIVLADARKGQFDAMVYGHLGTVDPDERFQQNFVPGGGINYAKFNDPQVNELVAQARRTTDQAQRNKLYIEAQKRLADVGPYAFVFNYFLFDAAAKYVMGYTYDFSPSYIHLREVWLDK
ncbi:MAG: hypothetical protein HYZ73_04445 [Elusimicrobia bacterium]|nr:hypothetical protein [Elusimicrobiota bacterium]